MKVRETKPNKIRFAPMKSFLRSVILLFLLSISLMTKAGMGGGGGGGSMGGGGGGGCPPFSPCWCASRPGHPSCVVPVPIDSGIIFLAIAGLLLGIYFIRKKKKKEINS